jgi:hypothetical protein
MEVIETGLYPLSSAPCEDVLIRGEHYVAVIDGESFGSSRTWGGRSAGRFAADVLSLQVFSAPSGLNAKEFFYLLNEHLAEAIRSSGEPDYRASRPGASVVAYCLGRREVWRLGAGLFAIDGVINERRQPTKTLLGNLKKAIVEAAVLEGNKEKAEESFEEMLSLTRDLEKRLGSFANYDGPQEFSFPLLNGSLLPLGDIEIFRLPKGAKELVLASDGYARLFPTLEESERHLDSIASIDPLAVVFDSSNRLPDDRSYIRLSL